jgi:hypothetical protein
MLVVNRRSGSQPALDLPHEVRFIRRNKSLKCGSLWRMANGGS